MRCSVSTFEEIAIVDAWWGDVGKGKAGPVGD